MIFQLEKNILKVLSVFSTSPGSNLLRKEIQELTLINNIVLDKTLARLVNSGFLVMKKRTYSLNLADENVKKIISSISDYHKHLNSLPLKTYSIIIDLLFEIIEVKKLGEIYLFGSYSKLIYTDDSDIDIAIISDLIKEKDKKRINSLARKIKKMHKKKIEVHYFGKDFYKNKKDPLVKDILKNGIKLN